MNLDDLFNTIDWDGGGTPCLVELGRAVRDGRIEAVGYAWSTGRIGAAVRSDNVRIERRLGVGAIKERGVTLTHGELEAVARAMPDWVARRDTWAAFYSSSAGYPAGFGGAWYYRPPGAGSDAQRIGSHMFGRRKGEAFRGEDAVVPAEPATVAEGVALTGSMWRRGERVGPAAGSLVGGRYALNASLWIDAQRHAAKIWRPGEAVWLEEGEDAFIDALVAAVRATPPRCR